MASGVCPAWRALGQRRGCEGGGMPSTQGPWGGGSSEVPAGCQVSPCSLQPTGGPCRDPQGSRDRMVAEMSRALSSPLPRQRCSPSPGAPRRQPERGSSQPVNAGARNICFPRAPSDKRSRHKAGIQASAARLGARPDHSPSVTSGETEAREDRAAQHQGTTPPKSQSWHPAAPLSVTASPQAACGQPGPPACNFLAGASLSQPVPLWDPELYQHPAPSHWQPCPPLPRVQAESSVQAAGEGRDANARSPRRRDDPSPQFPSWLPSVVQGASYPEAAPIAGAASLDTPSPIPSPALGIRVGAPSPLPAPCQATPQQSMAQAPWSLASKKHGPR